MIQNQAFVVESSKRVIHEQLVDEPYILSYSSRTVGGSLLEDECSLTIERRGNMNRIF